MHVNKRVRTCEGIRVVESALHRDGGERQEKQECGQEGDTEGWSHFNKAWASVGTRLSQQVAESVGPGQVGVGPGDKHRRRGNKGLDGSGIVGGKARCRGHAKCKADTGITLWQGRGWHSRTLGL